MRAALSDLVRQRLDPKAGPLLHVSGADVALTRRSSVADGFEVRRFALYDAREAEDAARFGARAPCEARALDVATFFSPRAAALFVRPGDEAGLADTCRDASPRSPSALPPLEPLGDLPVQADRRGRASDPPGRAG